MAAAHLGYRELTFARSRTIGSLDSPAFAPRMPPGFASKPTPSKWDDAHKWIASPTSNGRGRRGGCGRRAGSNRQCCGTVVVREVVREEEEEEGGDKTMRRSVDSASLPADGCARPAFFVDARLSRSAIHPSQHGARVTIQSATSFASPPPTCFKSVSTRDMGTEMTPIASQDQSRNGTPVRASSPPPPPQRRAANPIPSSNKQLPERELQMNATREPTALGTKLGKLDFYAEWVGKTEDGKESPLFVSERKPSDPPVKSVADVRAAAWEKAEKAKYLARFKRDEMKIQVWENHLKAKAEAETRKIEVEVERMRAQAQERLMRKLTSIGQKAEKKHSAVETKRNRQADKTSRRAEIIRRTGRIPSSFYCRTWCS